MKKTKFILVFTLCIAFFYGCSNEESFIEEVEGVTKLEKVDVSKGDTKETTNSSSETANKTEDWFNQDNGGNGEILIEESSNTSSSNTIQILIEYASTITTQAEKAAKRQEYADCMGYISHVNCSEENSNKEIWTIDVAIYNDASNVCPQTVSGTPIGPGGGKDGHMQSDPDIDRVMMQLDQTTDLCSQ